MSELKKQLKSLTESINLSPLALPDEWIAERLIEIISKEKSIGKILAQVMDEREKDLKKETQLYARSSFDASCCVDLRKVKICPQLFASLFDITFKNGKLEGHAPAQKTFFDAFVESWNIFISSDKQGRDSWIAWAKDQGFEKSIFTITK